MGRIIGYRVVDSTDHLIVDFNVLSAELRTEDGHIIWKDTWQTKADLLSWLDNHREVYVHV